MNLAEKGELKRGTESLICAGQEQALRTNYVRYSIASQNVSPWCRMCKEKTECYTNNQFMSWLSKESVLEVSLRM